VSRSTAAEDSLPDDDALDAFSNLLPPPKKRAPKPPAADTPAPATTVPGEEQAPPSVPEQAEAKTPAEAQPSAPAAPAEAPAPPDPAPAPDEPPAAEVAVRSAATPAPVQHRPIAELGIQRTAADGQRSTQCTVNVSVSVRDRFAAYQLQKKLERGGEPTNAVVVRRAVLHARRNDLFAKMLEAIRHRRTRFEDEDDDPEGLFGDVPSRRAERGRVREVAQQSFRPSYEELQVIDALVRAYGFENRSEFLDAALDEFLPPLPEKRRRT